MTRSGRAQKRSMVSPANAAEKSSQPTGIPTGSIAVMSVSSVTGIGAERSQPRLQRLKEYRIYFILPRGTFNKLNKLVSHSSKVLLSAEALFMLRNELNYAKMKIVIKMRHFCLRNSIKMYKTLVTRNIL